MGALRRNIMHSMLIEIYSSPNMYLLPGMGKLRLGGATGKAYMSAFIDRTVAERKTQPAASTEDQGTVIMNQTKEWSSPQNFLSKWLAFHVENPTRFTAYNVVVGMITNIVAGSDTTSATVSAILTLC